MELTWLWVNVIRVFPYQVDTCEVDISGLRFSRIFDNFRIAIDEYEPKLIHSVAPDYSVLGVHGDQNVSHDLFKPHEE